MDTVNYPRRLDDAVPAELDGFLWGQVAGDDVRRRSFAVEILQEAAAVLDDKRMQIAE